MSPALRSAAIAVACSAAFSSAAAAPTPERAAACVAALKPRADALAARLQGEQPQVEAELLTVLEHGFAFIGDAYLQGLRDKARAEALLRDAEQKQAGLPAAQLAERQAGCQREATKMLADASFFSRMVVSHAAKKRLGRLKQKSA